MSLRVTLIQGGGVTIGPGESRTVSIHFSPAARGSHGVTLTISDNAPGSPHAVTLSGTGIAPVAPEETIEIFAFMEAADESKRHGGAEVKIAGVLKRAGVTR